jgi:putative hydrolase of the HAD superfamily
MKRGLILDFGQVLVRPQSAAIVAEMARLAGLDVDEFHRRYWQHRPAYDRGETADRYWRRVLAGSTLAPGATDIAIAALQDADARSWTDYREEMWALAAEFRANGGVTGFLSNGVPEMMARVRAERPLADYFDVVIVSYEVGYTKPDPRIYELCLARLGVSPSSALFVDDRPENVGGAKRLRMETVLFHGDESIDAVRQWVAARPATDKAR